MFLRRTLPWLNVVTSVGLVAAALLGPAARQGHAATDFQVAPSPVTLEGNYARAQLLVIARPDAGAVNERSADLTHQAAYLSSNPQVVTVSPIGRLLAVMQSRARRLLNSTGPTRQ